MSLKKYEDYMDWEKLIQHCDILDGLTVFEMEKAKRAFQTLKKEFGDEFLKYALTASHPFSNFIINLAPWTRKWVIWFAEAIKELKDQENFQSLLEKLKTSEKFTEGLSVLKVAYKFSKAGFKISIDPLVNVLAKPKIPDIKIVNEETGEILFVEVTIQMESLQQKEAFQTLEKIIEPLRISVPFLHYCGRIYKTLSERHLSDIIKKIEKIIEKIKGEKAFHSLVIDDVIEIGIAPEEDKGLFQKWAEGRRLKIGEFSGPSYDVDEIQRTKRKIGAEQKQLPSDNPNIIVIMNNNLFFHIKDKKEIISDLEEEVYKYPHLLSAVIFGENMGNDEDDILMKGQHVFICKANPDLFVEQYIILFNQFCDFKISPATITKMYNAFRSC